MSDFVDHFGLLDAVVECYRRTSIFRMSLHKSCMIFWLSAVCLFALFECLVVFPCLHSEVCSALGVRHSYVLVNSSLGVLGGCDFLLTACVLFDIGCSDFMHRQ